MLRFEMRSTVILLFAKDMIGWHGKLQAADTVRMGQCISAV